MGRCYFCDTQSKQKIHEGNESIAKGQSDIRKGRAMVESGSILMRNSQRLRLGDELLPEFEPANP